MPKIVDREEMRNRLMDAAQQVFSQTGYHAATINDIAESADLGKGTMYLYFKSKEELAIALVSRIFDDMERQIGDAGLCSSLDEFLARLDEIMAIPDAQAKFVRAFFEVFGPSFASDAVTKTVSSYFDRLGKHYQRQIEHLQAEGEITSGLDPELTGRTLVSMMDGLAIHRGLFSIPPRRNKAMIRQTLILLAGGLRPT